MSRGQGLQIFGQLRIIPIHMSDLYKIRAGKLLECFIHFSFHSAAIIYLSGGPLFNFCALYNFQGDCMVFIVMTHLHKKYLIFFEFINKNYHILYLEKREEEISQMIGQYHNGFHRCENCNYK